MEQHRSPHLRPHTLDKSLPGNPATMSLAALFKILLVLEQAQCKGIAPLSSTAGALVGIVRTRMSRRRMSHLALANQACRSRRMGSSQIGGSNKTRHASWRKALLQTRPFRSKFHTWTQKTMPISLTQLGMNVPHPQRRSSLGQLLARRCYRLAHFHSLLSSHQISKPIKSACETSRSGRTLYIIPKT